jgi:hypothetical protein
MNKLKTRGLRQNMSLIASATMVALLTGCVGDNCFRKGGLGSESPDCREYRVTHSPPSDPGTPWYEYVLFPIFALSAAAGPTTEMNRSLQNLPSVQAGKNSYTDLAAQPVTPNVFAPGIGMDNLGRPARTIPAY